MKPISQLGYEQARDELIEVVRALEQGGLDLDASLKLWERGEELAKRCEEHLEGARKRVETALASRDDDNGLERNCPHRADQNWNTLQFSGYDSAPWVTQR